MKAFIFDPIWSQLVTDELLAKLESAKIEIVVTEKVAPLAQCTPLFNGSEPRILALNPDYVGWKLASADYEMIPNLKGILGAATSVGWIDRTFAAANDVPICNIRNFSTEAVAEWAITMMFNLARQLPRLIKDQFPLDFDKDFMKYRGVEIHGRTAGIIGLGDIGHSIAKRCAGLGMKVIYWSRSAKDVSYQRCELSDLFRQADVVFPTIADNAETRTLISPDHLRSMKSSAMLVSVVHGIYDQDLVIELVKNHKLFGYGFEAKPATFTNYPGNIWAAPAYAWVTAESMNLSMRRWVENMVSAAKGEFPNRVS